MQEYEFDIELVQRVRKYGSATVKANSRSEARKIFDKMWKNDELCFYEEVEKTESVMINDD